MIAESAGVDESFAINFFFRFLLDDDVVTAWFVRAEGVIIFSSVGLAESPLFSADLICA